MERGLQGRYEIISRVGGEVVQAFIPNILPPAKKIELTGDLSDKLDRALVSLGRLDMVSTVLPDSSLFLYMYVRKEAVLSSMIEGTQSSISDLLLYEMDEISGVPVDDTLEVSNYVKALDYGVRRIDKDFPFQADCLKKYTVFFCQKAGEAQNNRENLGQAKIG